MQMIDKSSPIPLYVQLSQLIENKINKGQYLEGELIPSEKALCERYDISRLTVREALSVLKQKKLIATRPGIGNSVLCNKPVDRDLLGIYNFDLQIEDSGHENHVELILFDHQYQSASIAEKLMLEPLEPLIRVVRLRSADKRPLFIESIYLSAEKFFPIEKNTFLSTQLFTEKLKNDYGVSLDSLSIELEPIILNKEQADLLKVYNLPAAGLLNERISYDEEGVPVTLSQWLFSQHRCRHLLKINMK